MKNKIVIAVGSNINSAEGIEPIKNCNNAINELSKFNINIVEKSSWYLSEPIPKSSQPKFYNSVVLCNANYSADKILKIIQIIEQKFGRIRIFKNMPRCIDLDIISFNGNVKKSLLTPSMINSASWSFISKYNLFAKLSFKSNEEGCFSPLLLTE